eukprot:560395_1
MLAWALQIISVLVVLNNGQRYTLSNWTSSGERFSEYDYNSIIAYDNTAGDVWILGGYRHGEKIYKYNVDNDQLTDVTPLYNPHGIIDFGDNTLLNSNAVMIKNTIYYSEHSHFNSLNIDTFEYTQDFMDFVDYRMCMVTGKDKTKLYVTAGRETKLFVIYDLLSGVIKWGPSLAFNHQYGGCHVVNNVLYVIGGKDTQTIEYIDLDRVATLDEMTGWNTLSVELPLRLWSFGSAIYDHFMFIIGGFDIDTQYYTDAIFIFDTQSNKFINNTGSSLPVSRMRSPAIFVESTVYLFKGLIGIPYQDMQAEIWHADLQISDDTNTARITSTEADVIDMSDISTRDGDLWLWTTETVHLVDERKGVLHVNWYVLIGISSVILCCACLCCFVCGIWCSCRVDRVKRSTDNDHKEVHDPTKPKTKSDYLSTVTLPDLPPSTSGSLNISIEQSEQADGVVNRELLSKDSVLTDGIYEKVEDSEEGAVITNVYGRHGNRTTNAPVDVTLFL